MFSSSRGGPIHRHSRKNKFVSDVAPSFALVPAFLTSKRVVRVALCGALLVLVVLALGTSRHPQGLPLGCKAFIRTKDGTVTGVPLAELGCEAAVQKAGGYCVCEGDVAVPAPRQRWLASSTCSSLCMQADPEALLPIPDTLNCTEGAAPPFPWTVPRALQPYNPTPAYEAVTSFWQRVVASIHTNDVVVLPPGPRTRDDDFVAKGLRMDNSHISLARKQWATFSSVAGPLPAGAFSGRGIAILAGDAPHLVPALIAAHMIRKTGCKLPIELWFPSDEVVSGALVDKLRTIGVHVCTFFAPPSLGKGFYMKAAVVALSSFEEVLLLDSDQVPVQDPTSLFDAPQYLATGALLWPDFWYASWAVDAAKLMDVRRKHMPKLSFESGQMLLNKTRTWPAIVSALHFNLHNQLFFPLFSNYMGQGDKETFGMALQAHRMPYHLVGKRVRSLGYLARKCGLLWCWDDFVTNTMVQHDPNGQIMFLHTNMKPKWRLNVPTEPSRYLRRWQVLNPGVREQVQPWVDLSVLLYGFDIEMYIHKLLVGLRCDEDVWRVHEEYYRRHPDELYMPHSASGSAPTKLLPFLPEGIQLLNTYERSSLSGPFLRDQPPSPVQVVLHWMSWWTVGRGSLLDRLSLQHKRSYTSIRARTKQQQSQAVAPQARPYP